MDSDKRQNEAMEGKTWSVDVDDEGIPMATTAGYCPRIDRYTARRVYEGWKVDVVRSVGEFWGFGVDLPDFQTVKAVAEAPTIREMLEALHARHGINPSNWLERSVEDEIEYLELSGEKDLAGTEGAQTVWVPGVHCDVVGSDWDVLRVERVPAGWKGSLLCDGVHEEGPFERYCATAACFTDAVETASGEGYFDYKSEAAVKAFLEEHPDLKALLERDRLVRMLAEGDEYNKELW